MKTTTGLVASVLSAEKLEMKGIYGVVTARIARCVAQHGKTFINGMAASA
jgi:hypothetical protein